MNKAENDLESLLVSMLETGHKENLNKKRPIYKLNISFEKFKQELKIVESNLLQKIEKLKDQLQDRLTYTDNSEKGAAVKLSWKLKMRLVPSLEDLAELLLSRKGNHLVQKNPCLDQKLVNECIQDFLLFMSLECELAQITKILEEIGDQSNVDLALQNKIGAICHQRYHYKIENYPELLIFEWESGKLLRDFQAAAIQTIVQRIRCEQWEDVQLELPAGGENRRY